MFERVEVRATSLDDSRRFYAVVLAAAGIGDWADFALIAADAERPATRGLHLGFAATSRAAVDAFWRAGVDAGFTSDGEPGPRPYTDTYYGAFLLDPDGNSAEAVHRDDVRTDGTVDHVWIRVPDLAATRAVYERAGAHAPFRLHRAMAGRVAFTRDRGGDFSILDGMPVARGFALTFLDGGVTVVHDADGYAELR